MRSGGIHNAGFPRRVQALHRYLRPHFIFLHAHSVQLRAFFVEGERSSSILWWLGTSWFPWSARNLYKSTSPNPPANTRPKTQLELSILVPTRLGGRSILCNIFLILNPGWLVDNQINKLYINWEDNAVDITKFNRYYWLIPTSRK